MAPTGQTVHGGRALVGRAGSRGDPDKHMETFGMSFVGLEGRGSRCGRGRRLGVTGAAGWGGAGHGPRQALLSGATPGAGGLAVRTSGTAFPTAPAFHGLESRPLMSPGSHCAEHPPGVWGLHS